MAIEQTLSIIKPDAVSKSHIGEIIHRFESAGIKIAAAKYTKLTLEQAASFYAVHKERPFFSGLINFISSGPIFVMVLTGENVILRNREIMGATNPKEAMAGTIRADFAASIDENAVHGSDAIETAREEISFFFTDEDIIT